MTSKKRQLVVVTGGTRGIGLGIVKCLASAGYEVVFTYEKSEAAAADLVQWAERQGCLATGYRCNAASPQDVTAFAELLRERHGAPYALVNNAGVTRDALMMHMTLDQWHEVVNANMNSAFYLTRALLADMVAQSGGCILQMSSVSALKGNRGQTNYAATKAALIGLTRALASEVGRFNVRVNAIAPGLIDTEMVQAMPAMKRDIIRKLIPLGRWGRVEEIAAMVGFLLSPDAAYITGQTFVIDGGLSM